MHVASPNIQEVNQPAIAISWHLKGYHFLPHSLLQIMLQLQRL